MGVAGVQATWDRLGREDPLWAIMPYPTDKSADWDLDEFMATGVDDVDHVLRVAAEQSMSLGKRVLDFGCGVGRLSNALAEHADLVVGVDIASSMIEFAQRVVRHPDRVSYTHYDGHRLPFPDDSFDSAVSLVVLQHTPPAAQLTILLELNRVIRSGGALVLQAPSAPNPPRPVPRQACRADIAVLDAPATLPPAGVGLVRARVTNRGGSTWPVGHGIKLGNHWFEGTSMVVRDDGRRELPHPVSPGGSVDLEVTVTAPDAPGEYTIVLDVVQELIAWWTELGNKSTSHSVTVSADAPPQRAALPADDGARGVEMHAIPTPLVQAVFSHCGGEVLSVTEDHLTDGAWFSHTFVIRIGGG